MSSGRHAGFMEGEEEGALLPDPRHCDGCLQAFPRSGHPGLRQGDWAGGLGRLRLQQESLRTQRGGEGRRPGAAGRPWGVFPWRI